MPYRIGSIILQLNQGGRYDIVDGQQRTLTLALICAALAARKVEGFELPRCLNDEEFYPALKQCRSSRLKLHNNFVIIDQYLKDYGTGSLESAFGKLEVVVIAVKTQPEAFQLFDSQNSRGRRLEPHDLLKAYHLRAARKCTDECVMQKVGAWEEHKSSDIAELFNDYLFPIYKWGRLEKCGDFTADDIRVFKGLPVNWINGTLEIPQYEYVKKSLLSRERFQIGEPIVPGLDFFKMVEYYFDLRKKAEDIIAKMDGLGGEYRGEKGCAYVEQLFKSVLLAYLDRFGLTDAELPFAIRKLFKWSYMVRVDLAYLGSKTVNKYALGGDGGYSNRCPMFARIKNARTHTEITSMIVNESKVKSDRWGKLADVLKGI